MPDDRNLPFEPTPPDWGTAFAALPQEAPDADLWPRIARARPRPRARTRWPAWLAAAAVLAMAAVVPWRLSTETAPRPDATAPADDRTAAPGPASVAAHVSADPHPSASGTGGGNPTAGGTSPEDDGATASETRSVASVASVDAGTRDPDATVAGPRTPRPAPADTRQRVAAAPPASDRAAAPATPASELEGLYAESAQLEALVALARDERVATTGAAAALTGQYDAQVAGIDARLVALATRPDAGGDERVRLWRARVDALRRLASFESTQRLFAAHGERYDAMLVSID